MRLKVQAELDKLGDLDILSDKSRTVLEAIQKFCEEFKAEIFGRTRGIDITRQLAKERIAYVFRETFAQGLESIDPLQDISDKHILNAILSCRGLESFLFLPEVKFKTTQMN